MAAGGRCAAIGATTVRFPVSVKVLRRYIAGASFLLPLAEKRSMKQSTPISRAPSWRASERLARGHDGRVVAVGSPGRARRRLRPGTFSQQARAKWR
jgi:hypothetical protein